jgi:DNA-binding NarL/FixJ family response regulator
MQKLLFFSDSPLLAKGFISIFASSACFDPVTVHDYAELLLTVQDRPDTLVLYDFVPTEDFLVLAKICQRVPHVKIALWSESIPVEIAYRAMKLGVRGIFRRSDSIDFLVRGLKEIEEGHLAFDKALTTCFLQAPPPELTKREAQIVPLVAQGLKNKEIASVMGIGDPTLRTYLTHLFRKLGVKDRYELALYGMRSGTGNRVGEAAAAMEAYRLQNAG